jgi:hypothetical protein
MTTNLSLFWLGTEQTKSTDLPNQHATNQQESKHRKKRRRTLTMGVMNSWRKPGSLRREGQKWCSRLISRPLMWLPDGARDGGRM